MKHFSDNSRDILIDTLKGIAILLVVLGHAIQTTTPNFDNNLAFRIIYSFHMPFFMFISGWVMAYSKLDIDFVFFVHNKAKRLVIPFICWYLLNFLLLNHYQSVNLDQYLLNLVKSPDYGLWFLWILFLCQVIIFFSRKLDVYVGSFHLIIPYLIILFLPLHYFGADLLKWHFKFFAIGYLVAKHKDILMRYYKFLLPALAALFPILVFHWYRIGEPPFLPALKTYLTSEILLNFVVDFYKFLVPLSGIGFTVVVTLILIKLLKGYQHYLGLLGLYTLDIYVLHFYFIGKINLGEGPIKILANFLCALALTYVVASLLRKSQLLSTILLGSSKKERGP